MQVWLPLKQRYRCVDGFCSYVNKDELVKSGSVISKGFVPLYPAQTGVNFDIYGCLHTKARCVWNVSHVALAYVPHTSASGVECSCVPQKDGLFQDSRLPLVVSQLVRTSVSATKTAHSSEMITLVCRPS
jgi:hypothetical protein